MPAWLVENAATVILCALLVLIVAAVIVKMVRDKKKGKHSCGCGCEHCALSDSRRPDN